MASSGEHRECSGVLLPAPPISPIYMLYSHVLESIFAFCNLKDMAAVSRVMRSWCAAVLKMRPISSRVTLHDASTHFSALCASHLRRHVSEIVCYGTSLATEQHMSNLAQQLPHLQSLSITSSATSQLHLPLQLSTLSLCIMAQRQRSELCYLGELSAAAVETIALLPNLTFLKLGCKTTMGVLQPLLALSTLRTLDLSRISMSESMADFTTAIRQVKHLHELYMPGGFERLWNDVLQPDHQLQLRTMNLSCGDTLQMCTLLSSLPSLTHLSLKASSGEWEDASAFAALHQLRTLKVYSISLYQPINPTFLADALRNCPWLTHLHLWRCTLPMLVTDCIQRMPQLRRLELVRCSDMTSLSFLADMLSSSVLSCLNVDTCYPLLPISELKHVRLLCALEFLQLDVVFGTLVSSAQAAELQASMPALHTLQYTGSSA
jgi:hypothetical protein